MNVEDLIQCADIDDCKKTLADLSKAGYGAVVTDVSFRWIRITSLPDESTKRRTE